MSDAALTTPRDESLRASLLIAYGLYLAALFSGGLTAVAGVIVVYARRQEARGTLWQSHCRNLLWVFWIAAAAAAVFAGVVLEGAGSLLVSLFHTEGNPPPELVGGLVALVPLLGLFALVVLVFYLYRTLRGFIHALDGRPY
ncbi:MAG: hypothetical protein ISS15_09770 [Alphaproteobacteria bacterium]|nr:hypothetical protein [Alphaproteobacteria bacterium]MBL6938708.1 hypothetical protein [Alphaproteobacteria bacterium]MBL7097935.1 hypothetical protein [Alphaproteobacteria bacterium]